MSKKVFTILSVLLAMALLAACAPAETGVGEAALAELQAQLEAAQAQLEAAQAEGVGEEALAELQAQLEAAQAQLEEAQAAAAEEVSEFETYTVEFKNPDTLINMVIGEPETLDPAIHYDSASSHVLRNIYDPLLFFKGDAVDEFVGMLATDWSVSDDGLTYTLTIREGVTFHEGGTLEPHDVAYTFHRNLLLGWDFLGGGGPMGLYFDPMFGTIGIGEEGDGGLLDIVGGDDVAVCEAVKQAVVADDEAGTVTITLNYPASYFPQLLAQPWMGVMDKEWAIEQGAWDDDCTTWRDWYLPEVSESTFYSLTNGTGPYRLDHWTPGDEVVLTANENWWVTEPLWEGSTIDGVPEIDTIVIKLVEEWGTRLAAVQAGDADIFDADIAFAAQVEPLVKEWIEYDTGEMTIHNPGGILRMYHGLPEASTADLFMNQNIATEGGNPLIGSGQLDGQGIPPDFFSDIHVRKAFNYCFDRDTFIQEVRLGEAIPHRGPIIEGMMGYDPDSFIYPFDIEMCREELKQAFDGQLWENGFSIQLAYNTGNDSRRLAAEILRNGLLSADENGNITVGVVSMPWPSYLAARRAGRLPIHLTGWIEDFHHPHNWVVPYMSCNGDFSGAQGFPEEICGPWDELMQAAVRESDPAVAEEMYRQLQAEAMEQAIDIFIHQPTVRFYSQLWVQGWYFHPMMGDPYYASLSKVAP
ncbi:MAG: ABC transporter substrate-binding protein [Anaerolineae bacterium]